MQHKSFAVLNAERATRRVASSAKKKKPKATSYKQQAAGHNMATEIVFSPPIKKKGRI
tara:strand:+ start:92 stop:265 length:174 start_codon:yes stop_codon:yes gene_type:complete